MMKSRLIYSLRGFMFIVLTLSILSASFASLYKIRLHVRVTLGGIKECRKLSNIFTYKIHSLNLNGQFQKSEFSTKIINYIATEFSEHDLRISKDEHEFDTLHPAWHEAAATDRINKRIDKISNTISLDDLIDLRNYIRKFYNLNQTNNKISSGHTLDCDKEFARLIESARNWTEDGSSAVVDGNRPIR